ncbi:MAG TPA: DUF72 domain-containing protein [Bryobacteraceae bacterium]|nr:DUF72 domain-containing protein [Bryobacteraceae bacterium]
MLRIGTAGWQYRDWEGIVYPRPKPRGFDPLSYLANFFDVVEINSSFYGPPQASTTRNWVVRVSDHPEFRFTAKLWKGFTHERNANAADEKLFKEGMEPLSGAGRLGAILLQFPWSFRNEPENRNYLRQLRDRFAEYPLVLEVRHRSWIEPDILDMLAELGVGLCNIDQPQFHRSVKPAAHATSVIGYVRLHGRNYKNWFSAKANVRERYDFLYSLDELEPWAGRIKALAEQTVDTYAVANNHNLGKAVVNAFELTTLLLHNSVNPPPQLVEAYPELQNLTRSDGSS